MPDKMWGEIKEEVEWIRNGMQVDSDGERTGVREHNKRDRDVDPWGGDLDE